jgi:hypothetical protein
MATHTTWSNWFVNHASNNAENQNLKAFRENLNLSDNDATKLQQLVEEINSVILEADANECNMILHSPKNLVGLKLDPKTK